MSSTYVAVFIKVSKTPSVTDKFFCRLHHYGYSSVTRNVSYVININLEKPC